LARGHDRGQKLVFIMQSALKEREHIHRYPLVFEGLIVQIEILTGSIENALAQGQIVGIENAIKYAGRHLAFSTSVMLDGFFNLGAAFGSITNDV
jgi:hypothetical protein